MLLITAFDMLTLFALMMIVMIFYNKNTKNYSNENFQESLSISNGMPIINNTCNNSIMEMHKTGVKPITDIKKDAIISNIQGEDGGIDTALLYRDVYRPPVISKYDDLVGGYNYNIYNQLLPKNDIGMLNLKKTIEYPIGV